MERYPDITATSAATAPNPGLGDERNPDIPARHQRDSAHPFGGFAQRDTVQDRVERPPALQPHEPAEVGTKERARPQA